MRRERLTLLRSCALRRPQAVTATAAVLFQRFYCKRSFAQFNVKARPSRKPQLTR